MTRTVYALLVAIDHYPPGVPPLNGCVNDIQGIAAYLQQRVANCQIKILANQDATYQAIVDGFRTHLGQAGNEDTAFFYYAGHGSQELAPEPFWVVEPDRMNETLVCYDSRTDSGWDLADKELAQLIAEVSAKNPHFAMILDCCHSGSGTRNLGLTLTERRVEASLRQRPVESYLVAPEAVATWPAGSRSPQANPAGWQLARGRHVLFSACRSSETAKEYSAGGQQRGAFSYFLQEALAQTNGNLTYRDLFERANALVRTHVPEQSPQLEAVVGDDLDMPFLGGAVMERSPYFTVSHHPDHGWVIDGGQVHGVPASRGGETTQLALFPLGATADQMKQATAAIATATVTQVLPHLSQIAITGLDNPATDVTYKAIVTSLPLPKLEVWLEGDEIGVQQVREALLNTEPNQQPSLYVQAATEVSTASLRVLAQNGELLITRPQDARPLVQQIPGYTPANAQKLVQRLEHMARWTNLLELSTPPTSRIQPGAVTLQLLRGDEVLKDTQIRLDYQSDGRGGWTPPSFKAKLTNTSSQPLYCALIDLSDRYAISAALIPSGGVWLNPGEEVWALAGDWIEATVPDEFWHQGMTEFKDVLKLMVSTAEFNPRLMEQPALDGPRSRSVAGGSINSTLGRLTSRMQTRDLGARVTATEQYEDWATTQVTITTVRPLNATPLPGAGDAASLGLGVTVLPHGGLKAQARLATVNQATRDLGNRITPPLLRVAGEQVQPFQFTASRGTDPGLSALELNQIDASTLATVTPDHPLTLVVDAAIAEDERILPIAYDGEFFLPLGLGKARDGKTEISLERLPQPVSDGQRSLGGAIRVFFQKIATQRLGLGFDYPLLSVVDVGSDGTVHYTADPDQVRSRLASAKTVVMYVHGIIGDTLSMVPSVRQAKLTVEGQERCLADLYDVVLAFDYESLGTPIEDNARLLKQRLEAVGLGAGHGKVFHIVAHSMGGLVSRWLIEQEGGNALVNHLIMLGTPNAGSPWPKVEELATNLLAVGLNSLSVMTLPVPMISVLLKTIDTARSALDKKIDVTLTQMMPGSEVLTRLAESPDPGVPYTILAGNLSIVPTALQPEAGQTTSRLARLLDKTVDTVAALPFFGLPNDIAVTVESIKQVASERSPQPQKLEIPCDHLVYFTQVDGLNALALAVHGALAQSQPSSSPEAAIAPVTPTPEAIAPDLRSSVAAADPPASSVPSAPAVVPTSSAPTAAPVAGGQVPRNAGGLQWLLGAVLGALLVALVISAVAVWRSSNPPPPDATEQTP